VHCDAIIDALSVTLSSVNVTAALAAVHAGASAETVESETLEFKQQDPSLKRCLEIMTDAVVCQANAGGGRIVLGVADGTSVDAIVGVTDDMTTEVLVRGIFDRTRPALSVFVEELDFDGARLLVVTVPRGATFYSNSKGTATRRVGRECRPFPPEEQKQALSARGLHDWSALPSGAPLVDVDADELARVRRLLNEAGRSALARADDAQLLSDLGLIADDGSLRWAGLLLLGRDEVIARLAPQHGYAYQYRPSLGAESTARIRAHRPLLAAVDHLLDAVETRRSVHALNIAGGVQLQLHDYPSAAVRELVVNALVHRDFEVAGGVEVEHSPERLVISSPGGLVFGVTPDNILTHPSTPRNRLLLDTVTVLQVAERTGQGVDRAYREMLRVGKKPPEHADLEHRVEARLQGGNGDDAFVRYVRSELDDDVAVDVDVLLVLDLLRATRSVSAATVAATLQRPADQAQSVLARLASHEVIAPSKRTARSAFPNYSLTGGALAALGRAVEYHRPTTDERDAKVVEHVREYGFITNQTLRRMFDVTLYQARDMLRDLQQRGVLTKLDDRTGGRGVRYGLSDPSHTLPNDGR
jgi:ATP-dependent DNA helicase RecG